MNPQEEKLHLRTHGDASLPTLIYLPGVHGDWTLVSSFRAAVAGRVRFVEFTYPRSPTWSVHDYANAVERELSANGISSGWLLAESFGSLIAWAMIDKQARDSAHKIQIPGLILAGGFVKHPFPRGARFLQWFGEKLPTSAYRKLLRGYAWFAKFRHRHAPETLASMDEFVARRTELDRQAMRARLELVEHDDPRSIARQTTLPVFYLAGAIDPLVPWFWVRAWLRRNCPGYRAGKTCWLGDHNVLGTAPKAAAALVSRWIATDKGKV